MIAWFLGEVWQWLLGFIAWIAVVGGMAAIAVTFVIQLAPLFVRPVRGLGVVLMLWGTYWLGHVEGVDKADDRCRADIQKSIDEYEAKLRKANAEVERLNTANIGKDFTHQQELDKRDADYEEKLRKMRPDAAAGRRATPADDERVWPSR